MKLVKKMLPLMVVLIMSYWAVKPLFVPGFYTMHDDTQVQRVYEMKTALVDGFFPVRWVSDLGYGYGYPIFNFYGPLAYYTGGFLALSGLDSLTATKVMMGLGIVLCGIFMYFFARQLWGVPGGIISALLYVYAPYHALDIYVRGDVAEFYAYAFIPLAFLGMYKLYRLTDKQKSIEGKDKQRHSIGIWWWVAVTSAGFAGVIISHNLTAMMVCPFLLVFALLLSGLQGRGKLRYLLFSGLVLGIMLSCFYWLPALTEMKYTNVASQLTGGSSYKDNFACLSELWNSPWGYGGSIPGCIKGLSLRMGKIHIIFSLVSALVLLYFLFRGQFRKLGILMVFFAVSLVFSVFLLLKESSFIWNGISLMAYFQYPWRFLVMASFFASLLSGSLFYAGMLLIKGRKYYTPVFYALWIIALIGIIAVNQKVFVPQTILHMSARDFTSPFMLNWVTSKISDEYMPAQFDKPKSDKQVPGQLILPLSGRITVVRMSKKTQAIHAVIQAQGPVSVLVSLAYFPGWHVYIDGKPSRFGILNRGLAVKLMPGLHTVDLLFIQTIPEKTADAVSLTGVMILLLGIIYLQFRRYDSKKI